MQVNFDLTRLSDTTNPVYIPLYYDRSRYLLLYGGAGSGKSHFAAQKVLVRIMMAMIRGYKERFLVVRKTKPALRKSVYTLLLYYINLWGLNDVCIENKTHLSFKFSGGSEIICTGCDDVEKLKSIEGITSVWLEEATELSADDLRQLDLRLRGNTPSYKQIILSFNPIYELHHIRSRFFEQEFSNVKILHTTYKDNLFCDPEYKRIIEDLATQNKTAYQIYGLGEWGTLEETIYNNWIIRETDVIPAKFENVHYGLDFGFNNPSAFIPVGERDRNLYIFNEIYETKLTNPQLITLVKKMWHPDYKITADSAEPARIQEFRDRGLWVVPSIKGPSSVRDGIDWVKRRIIYVHPRCVNTIKEFRSYSYKKNKDGLVLDEPVQFMDHAMDAIRYAVESLIVPVKVEFEALSQRTTIQTLNRY